MNAVVTARRWRVSLLGVLLAVLLAPAANAGPVTVFFTGTDGYGVDPDDVDGSGLSIADSGLALVEPDIVAGAEGVLSIFAQNVDTDSFTPFPPAGGGASAASSWLIQNVLEDEDGIPLPLDGETWLLFVTSDPVTIAGEVVAYSDENVGLSIAPESGWVFVRAGDYYFPAITLGALEALEVTDPFGVYYRIAEPVQSIPGRQYVLPQLRIGAAFTPIPEPATAALMLIGLGVLAAGRRR